MHGWSTESPVMTMTAMVIPSKVDQIETSLVGTDVKISWNLPFTGGTNIAITAYDIKIAKGDGSLISYTPACDGTSSTIIS